MTTDRTGYRNPAHVFRTINARKGLAVQGRAPSSPAPMMPPPTAYRCGGCGEIVLLDPTDPLPDGWRTVPLQGGGPRAVGYRCGECAS